MKYWLGFMFFFVAHLAFGQKSLRAYDLDEKSLKQYNEAIKLGRSGQVDKAIKEFEKIQKKFPTLYEASLRVATLYYEQKDYVNAKRIFDEVITKDKDYDAEMYFSAGMIAYDSKNYVEAEKYFNDYLWRNEDDTKKTSRAMKLKGDCVFRAQALKHPKSFSPSLLSNFINTPDSEFLPSLTLDGKTMIFTRRIDNINEDIFISHQDDQGNWSVAEPVEEINTKYNESAASISDDGTIMVFTKCDDKTTGFGSCDLYYVKKNEDGWGIPQNLGDRINTPNWESQPCVFDNGRSIIFSSDRKGGIGGKDLWMVTRGNNGKWKAAENLGEEVNTAGNEESPYLHPDGITLYFRSDGHPGMGSFDIFLSRWNKSQRKWGKALNLGYPINTEGSEGALFVSSDGKTTFYASDAKGQSNEKNNLNLFQFELPEELKPEAVSYVRLRVKDASTGEGLHPQYFLMDVEAGDTVLWGELTGNSTLFALRPDHNFAFHIQQPGYVFHSENFNTKNLGRFDREVKLEVLLRKVVAQSAVAPFVLQNIFFKTGSAELLAESDLEIEKLAQLLREKPKIKIKITGHTDDVGQESANLILSEQRAKSVVDALLKKGITFDRLTFEGKGESIPVASNETEEGRSKNRRTEFTILP